MLVCCDRSEYNNPIWNFFETLYDDIKAYRTSLECISNGPNKIKGENALYSFRKSKFSYLNKKEQNYVKCRHRAVIANAYKRQHKFFKAFADDNL